MWSYVEDVYKKHLFYKLSTIYIWRQTMGQYTGCLRNVYNLSVLHCNEFLVLFCKWPIIHYGSREIDLLRKKFFLNVTEGVRTYWKTQYISVMEFEKEPQTYVTITHIRDKFEEDKAVQNVHESFQKTACIYKPKKRRKGDSKWPKFSKKICSSSGFWLKR